MSFVDVGFLNEEEIKMKRRSSILILVLAAMLIVFVASACADPARSAPLLHEVRGELVDWVHRGHIAIVDKDSNLLYYVGDPNAFVFYRSISKPMQALPTLVRGLDTRYNLEPNDIIIWSASHSAEPEHFDALVRIAASSGIREDWMIMTDLPGAAAQTRWRNERPEFSIFSRPFFHNCSGKHSSLLLLQRELLREQLGREPTGAEIRDSYWKQGSLADIEVIKAMSAMAETDNFQFGIDGCGVPVFAAPMRNIAITFKNFGRPDKIVDDDLRAAASRYMPLIRNRPIMIGGTGSLCTFLNGQRNLVAKSGANAAYGFALIHEGIGVSIKFVDGSGNMRMVVMEILRQLSELGYIDPAFTDSFWLTDPQRRNVLINAAQMEVGYREPVFTLRPYGGGGGGSSGCNVGFAALAVFAIVPVMMIVRRRKG